MSRFIMPRQGVKGQNLTPEDGAQLFFKVIGQGIDGTNKDTFTIEALTPGLENTNPVIADATGLFEEIWLDGDHDVFLQDKNGFQLWGPETVRNLAELSDQDRIVPELTTVTMAANTKKKYAVGDVAQTAEFTTGLGAEGGGTYDAVLTSGVTPNTFNIIIGTADASISFVLRLVNFNIMQIGANGDGIVDNTAIAQAGVNLSPSMRYPLGSFKQFTEVQLSSNAHLYGEGTIIRDDDALDIFQAIGTQGAHLKNIRIEGLRFRDEASQSDVLDGWCAMLRAAYCDDVIVHNNNFHNVNMIRVGVTALHASTDEEAAYDSITDANMNQRISVTDNVGNVPNPGSNVGSGSYAVQLTFARDYIISNNVIDGYLDGIYINGGFLNAADPNDAALKNHTGLITGNTLKVVRVGIFTWSVKDVTISYNVLIGGTNEHLDTEASANVLWDNNLVQASSGTGMSLFFDCRDIIYSNNTIEMDQTAGSAPMYNASLTGNFPGDITFRNNKFTGTNGIATFNPIGNRYLQIEDNTLTNVTMVINPPMGLIDINYNKFIYKTNPPNEPIDIGSGILDTPSSDSFQRPTINIKYNDFINSTGAPITASCIEVGNSQVPCFYNFISNDIPDFGVGINLPVGYDKTTPVLHTIVTRENKFGVTGNFMLTQDTGLTGVDMHHVFIDNTDEKGLGVFPGVTPPTNNFYSAGSRNYDPTPSAAGKIGFVCLVEGKSGTWASWGSIT